jgi:hypothetical protein
MVVIDDVLKIVPEKDAEPMMIVDNSNEGAMVWVETSLRYARDRSRSKLEGLLTAVRGEIALEIELAKGPSARQGSGVR